VGREREVGAEDVKLRGENLTRGLDSPTPINSHPDYNSSK